MVLKQKKILFLFIYANLMHLHTEKLTECIQKADTMRIDVDISQSNFCWMWINIFFRLT